MPILTVFSGLPGAGKSTRAAAHIAATGAVLVGRDAIRAALVHLDCEWTLTLALVAVARTLLARGKSVAIDAPNLHPADRALWHGLAAESGAEIEWAHVATPLAECVARDAKRTDGIGAENICGMAAAFSEALARLTEGAPT